MHLINNRQVLYLLAFLVTVLPVSCNSHKSEQPTNGGRVQKASIMKPGSSFSDTLVIDFPATVFYRPDSLQLEKIRKVTDPAAFDGMMHEYEYLVKNARRVIKKTIPEVKIIDAQNVRYLVFLKDDQTAQTVDLDTKGEPFGLVLFNRKKAPVSADMANIETAVSFYFFKAL